MSRQNEETFPLPLQETKFLAGQGVGNRLYHTEPMVINLRGGKSNILSSPGVLSALL
jgi:hypothetical protein